MRVERGVEIFGINGHVQQNTLSKQFNDHEGKDFAFINFISGGANLGGVHRVDAAMGFAGAVESPTHL